MASQEAKNKRNLASQRLKNLTT